MRGGCTKRARRMWREWARRVARAALAPRPAPAVGRWCTHPARAWERKVDLSNRDYSCPAPRRREATPVEVAVHSGYGLG